MFTGIRTWIPSSNTLNNGVIFHFPVEKVRITSVATQGKANTEEYITEYFIQYSDDGELWANYVDSSGEFEVTLGATWKTFFFFRLSWSKFCCVFESKFAFS